MNYSCSQLRQTRCMMFPGALTFLLTLILVAPLVAQQTEPKYDPEGELRKLDEIHHQSESEVNRESGEDVRGREEWFYFQRRFPYDMIPAGLRANAIRETRAMQQRMDQARRSGKDGASIQAAARWEQIGPYNISGRARAIAVHPTKPETMFVGAAAGGVWKTTNGGTTWFTTFDQQSALAMGAIAIDYSNPSVIYVGTGENTGNVDSYLGDGIFKSTDEGATWTNIGLNSVSAFSQLYVHRQNSQIIYAVGAKNNGGFYRSTDGGASWKQVVGGTFFDMAVNPQNSNEVYIASSSSVRRSTDGGATFTTKTSGLTTTNGLRISIAVAESDPSRLYLLFARGGASDGSNIGEMYVSTDKAETWQLKYTFPSTFFNNQGWYDNCLAVDPENANVILAGGIDIFKSVNGGTSWTNTTRGYSGGNVHVDQHVVVFDPSSSSVAYIGNDGGVYRSLDNGSNWTELSTAMPTSQYYAMEVDPTRPFRVYGGTQDNGSHASFGVTDFPTNWKTILGGDGFFVAVDQTDPNYVYAENYNGSPIYRINVTSSSSNQRSQISNGIPSSNTAAWSAPLIMSPADKTRLYSGRQTLWRTKTSPRSGNPQWEELSPGNSSKISTIGLSPHDSKKMMIGTQGGELRFSTNDGATWTNPNGYPRRYVTDIAYDPVVDGRVYVTFSGSGGQHIYVSQDNGATFTNITSNLPDIPANTIAVDPMNNQHLFVGTDAGVFASLDGGTAWIPYNDGMALAPVIELQVHQLTRSLVAATHGRSMFRINIDNAEAQPLLIYPTGGETYITPGKVSVRWVGFNKPVQVLLSYDGGNTYTVFAENLLGDSLAMNVPFVKTTMARVKVIESGTQRTLTSGLFTLNPAPNILDLGNRGIFSEAIAVRNEYLWATQRGSDTIVKLKTPGVIPIGVQYLVRSGIPGTIRDLAYDPVRDIFYALVANANFSNAKVYRMDTNGVGQGEITLPVNTVSGISVVPQGLALITPGIQGKLYVIDPATGTVITASEPLEDADGAYRRGLVFDGATFVQGVSDARPGTGVPGEVQRFMDREMPRITSTLPVVRPTDDSTIVFFGLAHDERNSTATEVMFFATDTAGMLFRFTLPRVTLGVPSSPIIVGESQTAVIDAVMPNPFRGTSTIDIRMRSRQDVTVELFDATGERVADVFSGQLEQGNHTVSLHGENLASGVYHVVLTTAAGERDVRSVVVMR